MNKYQKLLDHAIELGIPVIAKNKIRDYDGCYNSITRTITITLENGKRETVYTLAHELGHAYYNHGIIGTKYSHNKDLYEETMKNEIEAWNYAIKLAKKWKFDNKSFREHIKWALVSAEHELRKVYF
jgi:Zn-dependent peptidase ImmA (M78 family)